MRNTNSKRYRWRPPRRSSRSRPDLKAEVAELLAKAEAADQADAADGMSVPEELTRRAMAHRLRTPGGRKLYALRKQVPEPVFGIIKSVLGFRQFLLRGVDRVRGEWSLVTMAGNMKRMFVLRPA